MGTLAVLGLPHTATLAVQYLGTVPYARALSLQQMLVRRRLRGRVPDTLLLLEHPHVFTTGAFRGEEDLAVPREALQQLGVEIVPANRGGSMTYHGPGQLVGYTIFDLRGLGIGVREYVARVEDSILHVLSRLGIAGERLSAYRGVWVGGQKICSIGIHVEEHVTMHGFALNVDPDLGYFDYINPCGLKGVRMTSIARVLGHPRSCAEVAPPVADAIADSFKMEHSRLEFRGLPSKTKGQPA
jgi:lipoate-protein ligase B